MKLKGLKSRAYNILFHTHTVSGIVISFGLYIIFYAGAFALFRGEMYQWENPEARIELTDEAIDLDQVITSIKTKFPDFAEEEAFSIRMPSADEPFLSFFGHKVHEEDLTDEEHEAHDKHIRAIIDTKNYTVRDRAEAKTTIGDTLYHLHYFAQIPAGLYISGLVALFFLFASITGVLIHWRNLITKFYGFSTKGKWKQIWTNAHTVLGIIGLPFQIIYAVSGALFGLLTLLLIPSALVLFGGDTDAILATVNPISAVKPDKDAAITENLSANEVYQIAGKRLENPKEIFFLNFQNYGKEDAVVHFRTDDKRGLMGDGSISIKMHTGKIISEALPYQKDYVQSVLNVMTRLHFGNFGGLALKVIYFLLAMLTCFMLISGILLWQAARDNKKYTEEQRLFQHRVTKVYLAICLGLFPATALLFIGNKIIPWIIEDRVFWENTVFFTGWLLLIIMGIIWDNYAKINKNYLLIGGVFSLLIPILNGVMTNDWFWSTLQNGQWRVASVDIFWLVTGIIALVIALVAKPKTQDRNLHKKKKIPRHSIETTTPITIPTKL